MIVMVMRQEDRRWPRKQVAPQGRHGRFGKPWHKPGIEPDEMFLVTVHQRGMPDMNDILISRDLPPMFLN